MWSWDVPNWYAHLITTHLAVPTSRASKIVQNAVRSELWLIINIIDWNDQTKGCSETTLTDDTQNYLYIIGAKFHILNHEDFPDISKKGNVSIGNLWLVCGITQNLWTYT